MISERFIKLFKQKGLAVIVYSSILESLLKQNKPTISELFDIMGFIQLGVDGFQLGLETITHSTCERAINTLHEFLTDLKHYLPGFYSNVLKK